MDPHTIVAFLPATWQPLAVAVLGLAGALYVVLHALDAVLQAARTIWPSASALAKLDGLLHALLTWWPHRWQAPSGSPPAKVPGARGSVSIEALVFLNVLAIGIVGLLAIVAGMSLDVRSYLLCGGGALSACVWIAGAVVSVRRDNRQSAPRGAWPTPDDFTRKLTPLVLLLAVAVAASGCATLDWSRPVLFAGPSVALVEVSPSQPTPRKIAAGAGEQLTLGLGQFQFEGKTWDALDLSAVGLGSLDGAGSVQVGGILGTMNDILGLGVLSTPWAADGSGYIQGGRPGATFAAVVNVQALVAQLSAPSPTPGLMRLQTASSQPAPRGGLTW